MTVHVKPRDISAITTQYLCNTCGACLVSCTQNALQFKETLGGYLFPEIERSNCTACGLCCQVCPGAGFGKTLCEQLPEDPFVGDILSCEVGCATDENFFSNSQSGGVATALLQSLFDRGTIEVAIVATMKVGIPPRGGVLIARNRADLLAAQKSKYVPIPMLRAFQEINASKGAVAFVGLPCHMHGLNNLFDKLPALAGLKIYKLGLVCDRVMLNTGIDFMASKATTATVECFTFRDNQHSSYPGNPVVHKVGGEKIVLDASLRVAIKDFFTPARCRLCFDKLNVFADVVCGDPHGIEGVDRQYGETLIIGRTQKGKEVIAQAKETGAVTLRSVCSRDVANGQGIHKKRQEWSSYMAAWDALGRSLPNYPFTYERQSDVSIYKQRLEHALSIDKYESRSDLMNAADRWVVKQKFLKFSLMPFRTMRAVMRKFTKRG